MSRQSKPISTAIDVNLYATTVRSVLGSEISSSHSPISRRKANFSLVNRRISPRLAISRSHQVAGYHPQAPQFARSLWHSFRSYAAEWYDAQLRKMARLARMCPSCKIGTDVNN